MRWSAQHGCVVLTSDLDFGAILAATPRRKPSVIQVRGDALQPSAAGNALVAAIRQSTVELTNGAIVSVDAARHRVRILPLAEEAD